MNSAILSVTEVMQASDASPLRVSRLPRGKLARLPARPGSSLVCTAGRLWLTRSADPLDYVLEAGQSLALDRETLVSALADGEFRLS